jgi:hypothetical protein
VALGDTYIWCPPGTAINHLWIEISDASKHGGKCVVINLTESSHGTHSYTLTKGQHRYIYKDSDVNFGDAFQTTASLLAGEVASKSAVPHDKMNLTIVSNIIKLAKTHPAFPPSLRKLLPP